MAARTEGEAIAQRLLADTAVSALVGIRVTPTVPTQDPPGDYVTYYRTAGGEGRTLGGRNRLQNYSVRIEAVAGSQAAANAILTAVVDSLTPREGWRDEENGVRGCSTQGDADESVMEDNRRVAGQTFSIWFKPQT